MKAYNLVLAVLGVVAVGCSNSAPSSEGASESNVTGGSCSSKIEAEVLKRAREINDEAWVKSTKVLYGNDDAYADAVLVRVSDETEPSDYLVFRSRLEDDMVKPTACNLNDVVMISTGVVPQDDALVSGTVGNICQAVLEEAVLEEAKKIDETASVQATKRLYGSDSIHTGGAMLVRVSDEVEPSDWVAVYHVNDRAQQQGGRCTVDLVKMVNSGVLADIDGLVTPPKGKVCTGWDGTTLQDGQSVPLDCNTCTCRSGEISCTEMFCGNK